VSSRLLLDHSDCDRPTSVLNDDLFAVLLDDTLALPASDGFDLVAPSSPSASHNHRGRVLLDQSGRTLWEDAGQPTMAKTPYTDRKMRMRHWRWLVGLGFVTLLGCSDGDGSKGEPDAGGIDQPCDDWRSEDACVGDPDGCDWHPCEGGGACLPAGATFDGCVAAEDCFDATEQQDCASYACEWLGMFSYCGQPDWTERTEICVPKTSCDECPDGYECRDVVVRTESDCGMCDGFSCVSEPRCVPSSDDIGADMGMPDVGTDAGSQGDAG
jgi:hypothetical protein